MVVDELVHLVVECAICCIGHTEPTAPESGSAYVYGRGVSVEESVERIPSNKRKKYIPFPVAFIRVFSNKIPGLINYF